MRRNFCFLMGALVTLVSCGPSAPQVEPLRIAYSDWPGWVAWDVVQRKGFFEKHGVKVELLWFDYAASMDAFMAGKAEAVTVTNGDALVMGAAGAPNVMILINDYSNGNDMVVARPGIETVADLKGKKIGVEVGFVDHLLLLKALESVGLKESDVTLVNINTNDAAQILASGEVDAVAAWQPNSGQALKSVPGSKAIFTSANIPGLIYDTLAVNPSSLKNRREDWLKVVRAWYEAADWLLDPSNLDEAIEIMSARVGIGPQEYKAFWNGTRILSLEEARQRFQRGDGFESIYGSTRIVHAFNLANQVYSAEMDVEAFLDPSFVEEVASGR